MTSRMSWQGWTFPPRRTADGLLLPESNVRDLCQGCMSEYSPSIGCNECSVGNLNSSKTEPCEAHGDVIPVGAGGCIFCVMGGERGTLAGFEDERQIDGWDR